MVRTHTQTPILGCPNSFAHENSKEKDIMIWDDASLVLLANESVVPDTVATNSNRLKEAIGVCRKTEWDPTIL